MVSDKFEFTDKGVEQALRALGRTSNEVAANLSALGFRGCRNNESNCPVANYLLAVMDGIRSVGVYTNDVEGEYDEHYRDGYVDLSAWAGGYPLQVDLPEPVVLFVIGFDDDKYPDLIEEASA
jgi:hypothetical protein